MPLFTACSFKPAYFTDKCPMAMNTFVMLTNLKLKSKVQVQVQTDNWVFIKIGFSNHPASQPHPATGKVSKKRDTVIYPKEKLLVYIRRL